MRVGVLWCTRFDRGWSTTSWRPLRHAYRNPSHVASVLAAQGHDIRIIECDEQVSPDALETALTSDPLDLLYVHSHGKGIDGRFNVLWSKLDWEPIAPALATTVVVFDTCNLLENGSLSGLDFANAHPSLRVVLGFDGVATVGRGITRGLRFAEAIVGGRHFCEAWIDVVNATKLKQGREDVPVAIALGDDRQDARHVFLDAALDSLPGTRVGSPTVEWGYKVA